MHPSSSPDAFDGVGVVLLQMGGPESLDEVESFLRRILSDGDIIRLPRWARPLQPVLAAVGALARGAAVRPMYAAMGGRSPIVPTTLALASRVEAALREQGHAIPVAVAMRYSRPRAEAAVALLEQAGVTRVVQLPLYPHYSPSTVGSSVSDFAVASRGAAWAGRTTLVPEWGMHPAYLTLLTSWVQAALDDAREGQGEAWHLLFSAHGLPQRYVEGGDGYPQRVRAAVEGVACRLEDAPPYGLAFQSRMGPVAWTRPYTDEALRELGASGVKSVVTVPMGFVSDHLETLYEIDILYREIAQEAGIQRFRRVPAFNDHPDFARFLTRLITDVMRREAGGG